MAKARKYRVWAATAESTSWEVAASLCFRSNYSPQKSLHISDKTMLQATSLIQAANFQERDSSQSQAPASLVIGAYDPAYCSVSLPSPQVLTDTSTRCGTIGTCSVQCACSLWLRWRQLWLKDYLWSALPAPLRFMPWKTFLEDLEGSLTSTSWRW